MSAHIKSLGTSPIEMKVLTVSTVAKAMTVPTWAIGQTTQQIPCIYLGG